MNIVEIEAKIIDDLKTIRNQEDLVKLQKWARKAKKTQVVEPFVTSFKQFNYWYETPVRSSGSGKFLYTKSNNVSYTSFVFLGIEIKLPESGSSYNFSEDEFNSHKIWVDRSIKYGGVEYFPKHPIKELFGFNLEEMFFTHLRSKGFFVVKRNEKTYYLCNNDRNAIKAMMGRRLTKFDLCNNPVVKITPSQAEYLKLDIRDWDYFYPQSSDLSFPFNL